MLSSLQAWLADGSAQRLALCGGVMMAALVSGCSATPEPEEPVVVVSTEPPVDASKQAKKDQAKKDRAKRNAQLRLLDRLIAEEAGILGVLDESEELNKRLSSDELTADGNMWGDSIGEAFNAGGLGLSGIGRGGGGGGNVSGAIGLGSVGTIGHGAGTGQGYGSGSGRLGRSRAKPPRIRMGQSQVQGALSKEVIRRIVRSRFAQLRYCYEKQLQHQPRLQGRLVTKFVIAKDGHVSSALIKSSTLSNHHVEHCVLRVFKRLRFPKPKGGGIVVVNYPVVFSPGKAAKPPAAKPAAPAKPVAPPPSAAPQPPAAPPKPATP